MAKDTTIHLIGNAHLDPVWLWRFPDGLSEIKATFRSALDRIAEFPGFIFTSACISYYSWVKENCPEMFREIQNAVKTGRWHITGAMWVQPDCNIPSPESFARHFLYSQHFVRENFGVTVETGYNVDSFGHTGALPKLLIEGGLKNYLYMRPGEGNEMHYDFPEAAIPLPDAQGNTVTTQRPELTFRWKCGADEVLAYRLPEPYCFRFNNDEQLVRWDGYAEYAPMDFMVFYGVGNHGGGPTITNLREIEKYQKKAAHTFAYSDPDRFFDHVRENDLDKLPVYEGDLQNHASGCYSANSGVKTANALCEDRLGEAEKWQVMANALLGQTGTPAVIEDLWKGVLFNQFHDILCGCSIEAAYNDARAFHSAAIAGALRMENQALQAISWNIDTEHGISVLSKEEDWYLWEANDRGTPVVVFNPLSRPVRVPVRIRKPDGCAGITYEDEHGEHPVPYQKIRSDVTNGGDKYYYLINASLPAFGYQTYWIYGKKPYAAETDRVLSVTAHSLENDRIRLSLDPATGNLTELYDKRSGKNCIVSGKVQLIDDGANDTWGHNVFVFDKLLDTFGTPEFSIYEDGGCMVSLAVTQHSGDNRITQVYTLYPGEDTAHISVRLFMNDAERIVKLAFIPPFAIDRFTYGSAGDRVTRAANGREEPMQRYAAVTDGQSGFAFSAYGKYSCAANTDTLSFIAVRTCYFADHYGQRDERMTAQDLGVTTFDYTLSPFTGDFAAIDRTYEEMHTSFVRIVETYHKGTLPQSGSLLSVTIDGKAADNVSLMAYKTAEDGDGFVFRFRETAGRETDAILHWQNAAYPIHLAPSGIATYRLCSHGFVRSNFLEDLPQ